jgi:hypothetical protein
MTAQALAGCVRSRDSSSADARPQPYDAHAVAPSEPQGQVMVRPHAGMTCAEQMQGDQSGQKWGLTWATIHIVNWAATGSDRRLAPVRVRNGLFRAETGELWRGEPTFDFSVTPTGRCSAIEILLGVASRRACLVHAETQRGSPRGATVCHD